MNRCTEQPTIMGACSLELVERSTSTHMDFESRTVAKVVNAATMNFVAGNRQTRRSMHSFYSSRDLVSFEDSFNIQKSQTNDLVYVALDMARISDTPSH